VLRNPYLMVMFAFRSSAGRSGKQRQTSRGNGVDPPACVAGERAGASAGRPC